MTTALAGSQVAHSATSGLLAAGEPPAPGENPGGEGLIVAVLERVGWTVGMVVLGVLVTLAGAAWMWRRTPNATGEERRRMR
ncbi:hypothetical protein GCM10018781_38420 [Kitasatospora indigofera]|uniref:Uncharacterized protein n=1 Tax=Kitasatospora indigofera TaxID=67307 RepID=A0A919KUI0_9ACTN|nr:hypothetical protein [Kitasatospora indigofera]GHH73615.1 hypothetical protein GCM10018781_38420 [Kitasatospora indigofera]